MTFSSIIRKNFIHNFNKYISFYFVNSLIITMLFMYGSLIFNETVLNSLSESSLYETINIALGGLIIFSIIFVTYTNVAFLKNRGKEFGMYLTLGMTTKDLTKLIFVENLGIMTASLLTGILSGSLFSRLFYMGLNKILAPTTILYKLNYKTFLLSIGIFSLIFLGNFIFNIFYIRRVSIIDTLKSSKKKELGKSNFFLGLLALILFFTSLYCLPKTLLNEIFKDSNYIIGIFVALTIICPYIIIGSFLSLIKEILPKFPKFYNKNLLVLSNLSHRFLAYKNILYMLSLLVAGAMFFVGFSYFSYTSTRESVNKDYPFDIMFVESNEYNNVKKHDIENILKSSNGTLEKYRVLEYIEVPRFNYKDNMITFYSHNETIISETNYNKHMNENIDVKPNTSLYVTVANETMAYNIPTSILTVLNENQIEEISNVSIENDFKLNEETFRNIIGNSLSMHLEETNIKEEKNVPFTNSRFTNAYSSGWAFVLDDKDYELLKNNSTSSSFKKLHLINMKNGDKAFNSLIDCLRKYNNLDNSYWTEGNIFGNTPSDERGTVEAYRPVYKDEIIKLQLANNGIMFFTMMFIGLLFVIANGVVLYYKVLSDIEDENERLTSLTRIGILPKEIKSIISKELAITFFIPIIIGGGMGLYYLYIITSNTDMVALLMKKSLIILTIGILIQCIFYLISRKKYIKEVINNH